MTWLQKNLLFTIVMVLLSALLAAEIFYVVSRRAEAAQIEQEYQQKLSEHQQLISKRILPVPRNVEFTQQEIEVRRTANTVWVAPTTVVVTTPTTPPVDPTINTSPSS